MGEKNIFQEALDRIWNKEGKIYVETPTPSLADFLFPTMSDEEKIKGVIQILDSFVNSNRCFFDGTGLKIDLNTPTLLIVFVKDSITIFTKMPHSDDIAKGCGNKENPNVLLILSSPQKEKIEKAKSEIREKLKFRDSYLLWKEEKKIEIFFFSK